MSSFGAKTISNETNAFAVQIGLFCGCKNIKTCDIEGKKKNINKKGDLKLLNGNFLINKDTYIDSFCLVDKCCRKFKPGEDLF